MLETGRKRKRPPTFQHFPLSRGKCWSLYSGPDLTAFSAKRLKQNWVQKTKIKSKWKATKRQEGLTTQSQTATQLNEEEEGRTDSGDEGQLEEQNEGQQTVFTNSKEPQRKKEFEPTDKPNTSSLREMSKVAYLPSTLHTYKAHHLNRKPVPPGTKRGRMQGEHRGSGRGEPLAVGTGRGAGGEHVGMASGRGRGQPNMKLRMGVLLEKIKRDFT